MNLKKIAATAAMTAGLDMTAFGVGAGTVSADDFDVPFVPDIPFNVPGLPGLINHL